VIPDSSSKHPREYVQKYPGIKEDVYVPIFKPDPAILKELDIQDHEIVVVIRPPATEAHYHNPESETLFKGVVDLLKNREGVHMVLLPRTEKQGCLAREAWPDLFTQGRIIIPPHVVNGLNLIWHADLVISGGGTMNREAAALGVPVYSIFRGTIGAVDKYLAKTGRLTLIEDLEDVAGKIVLAKRKRPGSIQKKDNVVLNSIVDSIELIYKQVRHKGKVSANPGSENTSRRPG
jgi:predicted glycosyltransferase